tara:strand:+ start:83 stop:361 length:279 start_codon:yes stop_codon:yes gene_type:complete
MKTQNHTTKITHLTELEIKALAIIAEDEDGGWYQVLFSKSARDKAVFGSLVKKGLATTTPEDLEGAEIDNGRGAYDWVELTEEGVMAACSIN